MSALMQGIMHYRQSGEATAAVCGTDKTGEDWTLDPSQVTCLPCILADAEEIERTIDV